MKIAFSIGVLLGLAGILSGAALYPWVDHPRLPSRTQVMANGGRAEQFVVRLPVDRITTAGTEGLGIRATPFPAGAQLPERLSDAPLMLEHFKARDTEGNVIGIAARHLTSIDGEPTSAWAITVPSRGTLRLTGTEEPAGLDVALAEAGGELGQAWEGDLRYTVVSSPTDEVPGGTVAGGSGEFRGLAGNYSEIWLISGVDDQGELRGTIELSTTTYQRQ